MRTKEERLSFYGILEVHPNRPIADWDTKPTFVSMTQLTLCRWRLVLGVANTQCICIDDQVDPLFVDGRYEANVCIDDQLTFVPIEIPNQTVVSMTHWRFGRLRYEANA